MKTYAQVVQFLEGLQVMPKTMPGLEKIKKALVQTEWFAEINPAQVIVVAGTNGKGSTCAMLEALLMSAQKKVGFYSSPHLVTTTERIRVNQEKISEEIFVQIFTELETLILGCELSHFEALTLMAGHYFFSKKHQQNLDYVILEVGLGGTFDATNAFPHSTSVITPLALDHTNILGKTIVDIAKNKFGIIQTGNKVIHQKFDPEVSQILKSVVEEKKSIAIEVEKEILIQNQIQTKWGQARLSLLGKRAAQNAMTALTVFEALGFDPRNHLQALNEVQWPGRMQKINWPGLKCPLYLSGDHNLQGIQSLVEILSEFKWQTLHLVVGIGVDKDADEMLSELKRLSQVKLYLTVTPFKGLSLSEYPTDFKKVAFMSDENPERLLHEIAEKAAEHDLVVVTGSLYLVGEILKSYQLK